MSNNFSIINFYKDKSILITGGTGFMGKILIEKLLYSVDIKQIFLLIRPKKGKTPQQRIGQLKDLPLFDRIRNQKPRVLEKIIPVIGDPTSCNLGLSDNDLKMIISETNVIFHMAANLKMKDDFKDAIEMNLIGTNYLIEMAKKMRNLISFVHLSTAFCNLDQKVVDEKVYDHPYQHDPQNLIECGRWMNEEVLSSLIKPLIGPPENIYVYTKRLAEILVRDEFPNLPICIARPSIVTSSYKEPLAGWVDNINGPIGFLVGLAKGVIRVVYLNSKLNVEFIPVDIASNTLITIAAFNGSLIEKPQEIPVFNVTNSQRNKISWSDVETHARKIIQECPIEVGLWYPNSCLTHNYIKYKVYEFFFHFVPALLIDVLLFCFMQKRFMMRIYEKVSQGMEIFSVFTTREWKFTNSKVLELETRILEDEREIFYTDPSKIPEFYDYLKNVILGARQYYLKEPLSTIPKAKRQLKIMWSIDLICKFFIFFFFSKFLLRLFWC